MSESPERFCECKMPQRYAADQKCPVEFDEQMGEYNLVKNGHSWVMRHCFWCGGALPESKRSSFFTQIDEGEQKEILKLLQDKRSIPQVIEVLGEPDERCRPGGGIQYFDEGRGKVAFVQALVYERRWRTIRLVVQEQADGQVSTAIMGRYVGPPGAHPA